jgi:glutaredoxin-like protein
MALLTDSEAEQIRGMLEPMVKDVHLKLYTQKLECPSCPQAELIVRELDGLSDRIRVEYLNPLTDGERSGADGIEGVPAVIVSDGTHDRVRFYGTPSGYEFTSFLTAIVDTGSEGPLLEPDTLDFLEHRLDRDLDLKVFVTTSCPHCPRAVVLAHRLAMASARVRSSAWEAGEFPGIASRHMVQGVPRTVVNDILYVEGAIPEGQLVLALERALSAGDTTGRNDLLVYLHEDWNGEES